MIKTYTEDLRTSVTILGYDYARMEFEEDGKRVKIGLYSGVKDSKGDPLFLESTYFIRGSND